ncbi:hypothetical protein L210DRAFT_2928372 [Boletus edulis BED1]|uniref:Uncharacterized protein n=1 Tax=Boletus edulis BED1 TaxID=1328754 RepID=A0AAD4GJ86_BOLED|nr:hypothetical protein L210DRAFT_2928372 [Boletus edulis BED1]
MKTVGTSIARLVSQWFPVHRPLTKSHRLMVLQASQLPVEAISLPRTPQARRLGAMLTNTPSKFTSAPTSQLRRARKRPRLEDPFESPTGLQISTRMDSLEMTMKDLLERQTELLSEILDMIRKGNPTS